MAREIYVGRPPKRSLVQRFADFYESRRDHRAAFVLKVIAFYAVIAVVASFITGIATGNVTSWPQRIAHDAEVAQVKDALAMTKGDMGAAAAWDVNEERFANVVGDSADVDDLIVRDREDAEFIGGAYGAASIDDDDVEISGETSETTNANEAVSEANGKASGKRNLADYVDANWGAGVPAIPIDDDMIDDGTGSGTPNNADLGQEDEDNDSEGVVDIREETDSDGVVHISATFDKEDRDLGLEVPVTIEAGSDGDGLDAWRRSAAYVPDAHKQVLIDFGWKVVLTDADLKDKMTLVPDNYESDVILGLCDSRERIIYVSDNMKDASRATVHEIGHMIDYMIGLPSRSDGFKAAYEADKDSFEARYPYKHLDETSERFAEAYKVYYTNPVGLEECAPHIYMYLRELL